MIEFLQLLSYDNCEQSSTKKDNLSAHCLNFSCLDICISSYCEFSGKLQPESLSLSTNKLLII